MPGMVRAFTPDLVQRIARISPRQLGYWEELGIVRPSLADHEQPGLPRLYSFRDLIALKVAAEMRRRHMRPGRIKALMDEFEDRGVDSPLLTLRFFGDPDDEAGTEVYWYDPSIDGPLSARALDQLAHTYDLKLKDLRSDLEGTIAELTKRPVGEVERVRSVQGSQPVIAGTRVPTAKIAQLSERGWDRNRILYAFPSLSQEDVDAALTFEETRKHARSA
jgi:uncharacterized protein (DUF433 family)